MPAMMSCSVRRPEQCRAIVIYDGIVYNWIQVAIGSRVLCFCPEHEEEGQKALKLAKYRADLEKAQAAFWKERRLR